MNITKPTHDEQMKIIKLLEKAVIGQKAAHVLYVLPKVVALLIRHHIQPSGRLELVSVFAETILINIRRLEKTEQSESAGVTLQ
jgi:hypothetical protein